MKTTMPDDYDFVTDETLAHLGGNISYGDLGTFCPGVWDHLIDRFAVSSVLDIGSGIGFSSEYFFRKGVRVVAVDGLPTNCVNAKYPTVLHDLTKGPFVTSVDMVHCQEVVEHIEERYLDNLLASMACGRVVVMTHALPGQGGYHHVNLQPPEYWIHHMARYGMKLLAHDTDTVRRLANERGGYFMAQSGLVFANPKLPK